MSNMTKAGIILIACALLAGGAYLAYGTGAREQAESPANEGGERQAAQTGDGRFAHWGNIVNVEETTSGLVYEEPGKPALKVDLVFTMATICGIDGKEATCPLFSGAPLFAQGARVYVEGERTGQIVTVTRITEQARR